MILPALQNVDPCILSEKEESSSIGRFLSNLWMPIPPTAAYHFVMETSFRMRVEVDSATTSLESALAIIRRGGVQLRGVSMAPGVHGMNVDLQVEAEEEDALVLCRMRLCNVIGILKIRERPRISRPL
ncbi:hypothetical protein [Pseudoduganella sp. RAF53_2]|uniref:hypothetical protein n=1 Tax=unclassified Pseudoduganella TaxID=2637179 RepID=UPI003F9CDB1D